jgi:serine/threonine protein phosphatase PrpC
MPQGSSLRDVSAPRSPATPERSSVPWREPAQAHCFAMLSDPGRIRQTNEDTCGADPAHGAFAICDGMGGAASGEIASQLACDAFLASAARPGGSPTGRLTEAVKVANQAVYRYAHRSRAHRGMGTTLVALLSNPGARASVWVTHVGDSRCYRFRSGVLELLTEDHSLIQEQIRAGLLGREEAESSPIRNIITRAIGTASTVVPDIAEHPAEPGDLLLLASDGLTRELSEEAIAAILREHTSGSLNGDLSANQRTLADTCAALVEAANRSGGRDNVTVLLLVIP